MKQNYNLPFFIVDIGDGSTDASTIANIVKNAFLKEYPTYKEAKLFALAGGTVYTKIESEILDETNYTLKSYYQGYIAEFGVSEYADGNNVEYLALMVSTGGGTTRVSIAYGSSDSGSGGGGVLS